MQYYIGHTSIEKFRTELSRSGIGALDFTTPGPQRNAIWIEFCAKGFIQRNEFRSQRLCDGGSARAAGEDPRQVPTSVA
ncbi:hypothetical protein Mycch_3120 [Mycolicibacterium chubuense NBB4]|uniref:Uncharacterized protein n=1 Tax=Mycolicibacterium chubuense (strain NBB4) TaxID=710421 RepID=I4BKR4_MYCCN|nr:hypothetical protein [Mycolicibacterium chubuense]AFM17871.1 hypothetical protein Mycch_3120 [Mycolicibacterium chubuense NBB4]